MGHNLMERNGRAAMMYVGERPWHELGTELKEPATAAGAIAAAQLDYPVGLQPIYVRRVGKAVEEGKVAMQIPGRAATVNMESGAVLGLVSDSYKVIQNVEAFSFFDTVVGEGKAIYHTAGALGQGERIWILAQLPGSIVVAAGDVTEKFLLLVNGHDGGFALRMLFTPIRVVCQNTLTAALGRGREGEGWVYIRHTGDIQSKVQEAQNTLGIANDFYAKLEGAAHKLVAYKMTHADIQKYIEAILPDDSMSKDNLEDARITVGSLAQNGKGQRGNPEVQGTGWAYWQGAVEYADWHRRGMGEAVDASRKLASRWFGSAAKFKLRAFDSLTEIVGLSSN